MLRWIRTNYSLINKNRVLETWIATPFDYHYKVFRSVGGTYFFILPEIDRSSGYRNTFIWRDDPLAMLMREERKSSSIFDKWLEPVKLIYIDNLPTNVCNDIKHGKAICNLHWKYFYDMKSQGLAVCSGSECLNLIPQRRKWCNDCLEIWRKAKI